MASNIEQSLCLLLPTLSNALPSELVVLAGSLVAQSRNKASNLKPEEEIARPYACCEIACKRLGAKLRLPALHGRPPCAPRIYKKLLTFLEQALPAQRPKKPTWEDDGNVPKVDVSSARRTSSRKLAPRSSPPTAPRQTNPRRRDITFAGKLGQRGQASDHGNNEDGAPPWVVPLIRRLCQAFSTPLLVPHVYTGLCVILSLTDLNTGQEDGDHTYRTDVTGLTLALFLMVLSRMQRGEVSGEAYVADCDRACAVINEEAGMHLTEEHVERWVKSIASENLAAGQDWWSSVPEGVFDRIENVPLEEVEDDHAVEHVSKNKKRRRRRVDAVEAEQDQEGTLLPGLGTMMQASIDWLSEDRRVDYLDWRTKIEKEIERLDSCRERTRANRKGVKAR